MSNIRDEMEIFVDENHLGQFTNGKQVGRRVRIYAADDKEHNNPITLSIIDGQLHIWSWSPVTIIPEASNHIIIGMR